MEVVWAIGGGCVIVADGLGNGCAGMATVSGGSGEVRAYGEAAFALAALAPL